MVINAKDTFVILSSSPHPTFKVCWFLNPLDLKVNTQILSPKRDTHNI